MNPYQIIIIFIITMAENKAPTVAVVGLGQLLLRF